MSGCWRCVPARSRRPILDKGAIGGFVGRNYYLSTKGMTTAYDADRLATDTLRAIERNQAILIRPRSAHGAWLFSRLAPGLMRKMATKFVAQQRAGQQSRAVGAESG